MITLRSLSIRNFKTLRAIDLVFPEQASILIEGYNESGKSSLFEAIIFALYGDVLITEETGKRGKGPLESAVNFQADEASVHLLLCIGATQLDILRTLYKKPKEKKNGAKTTAVRLQVTRADGKRESVTNVEAANRRILEEMGHLTKDALLNSCFVEQKHLGKLEEMSQAERQESLEQLLNLARLQQIQKTFAVTKEEDAALKTAQQRLALAEHQRQIAASATALALARQARDRLTLAALLAMAEADAAQQAEQTAQRAQLASTRAALARQSEQRQAIDGGKAILVEVRAACAAHDQAAQAARDLAAELAQCDKAEAIDLPLWQGRLSEIQAANDLFARRSAVEDARRDHAAALDALERDAQVIADHQRAADELAETLARMADGIAARSNQLATEEADLTAQHAQHAATGAQMEAVLAALEAWQEAVRQHDLAAHELESWEARRQEYAQWQADLATQRDAVAALAQAEPALDAAHTQARDEHLTAVEYHALLRWIEVADEATRHAQQQANLAAAQHDAAQHANAVQQFEAQAQRFRQENIARGAFTLLSMIVIAALAFAGQYWSLVLLVGAGALGWMTWRSYQAYNAVQPQIAGAKAALAKAQQHVMELQAEERAWQTVGGGKFYDEAVRTLQQNNLAIPTDVPAARKRIATLFPSTTPLSELAERHRTTKDALTQAQQQRAIAEQHLADLERRLAAAGDIDATDRRLRAALVECEEAVATTHATFVTQASALDLPAEPAAIQAAAKAHGTRQHDIDQARAALPGRRQALEDLRALHATRQAEHAAHLDWLREHPMDDLTARRAALTEQRQDITTQIATLDAAIQAAAASADLAPEAAAFHDAQVSATAQIQHLQTIIAKRPDLLARQDATQGEMRAARVRATAAWARLRQAVPSLALDATLPATASLADVATALEDLRAAIPADLDAQMQELDRRDGEIAAALETLAQRTAAREAEFSAILRALACDADPNPAAIRAALPDLPDPTGEAQAEVEAQIKALEHEIYRLQAEGRDLAAVLGLAEDAALDMAECQQVVGTLEHDVQVKRQAAKIVEAVRERMIRNVLPQTTRNMQWLLPPLTLDRYRECIITDDYKVQVFDETAGRMVAKNIFSGGARDQFSLALRLAFALATLPEEVGTVPGFIFLDEPLSSFDGPRSEALVNLLTRGQIRENFSQIFVISHNLLFDRHAFTHHLRLEYGAVVESTVAKTVRISARVAL